MVKPTRYSGRPSRGKARVDVREEPKAKPLVAKTSPDEFVKRRTEVAEKDHTEFQTYLVEKKEDDARKSAASLVPAAPVAKKSSKLSRRTMLNVAVGTAGAAEAAVLGYKVLGGSALRSRHSARRCGLRAAAQHRPRGHRHLARTSGGKASATGSPCCRPRWAAAPTRSISTRNRVLASIWYWNYGDYNPISPPSLRLPERRSVSRLRVRQLHAGRQELPDLRHPDQRSRDPAPGFNIYRVRYDGTQMQLIENVSETTGLGLGVHVTVNPKDAQSYFVTDGQKDIAACFDRTTSRVKAALKFDWDAQLPRSARRLEQGRHAHDQEDLSRPEDRQSTTIAAPRARRSTGKWCRWANCSSRRAPLPGDAPLTLTGADGTIWHPRAAGPRPSCGCAAASASSIREKNFDPVAFLQFNKDSQDQYPVEQIDDDHWKVVVRQDLLAGSRDRLLARRQVPRA